MGKLLKQESHSFEEGVRENFLLKKSQRAVPGYYTLHILGTTTDPTAFTNAEEG